MDTTEDIKSVTQDIWSYAANANCEMTHVLDFGFLRLSCLGFADSCADPRASPSVRYSRHLGWFGPHGVPGQGYFEEFLAFLMGLGPHLSGWSTLHSPVGQLLESRPWQEPVSQ